MANRKRIDINDKPYRVIPEKYVPEVESELRKKPITIPGVIYDCSGIRVQGTRIKSFVFSTDIAVIKNCNAQAVLAVYPFTPQLSIVQSILNVSSVPVFAGVGGGTTTGMRSINIAVQAELMGAYGVVVNAPMENEVISEMYEVLDIPIVATIASEYDDVIGKINAGARILNVSGGKDTASLVKTIRDHIGWEFPIIATGGPTDEDIKETIEAGANAITYTPPSNRDLFTKMMKTYRHQYDPSDPLPMDQGEEDLQIEAIHEDLVFTSEFQELLDQEMEELEAQKETDEGQDEA